jgi:phosphoserine phosphatase RsbU/P
MSEMGSNHAAEQLERLELALRASNEGIWDWYVGNTTIHYTRRILEFLECGNGNAPNIFLEPYSHVHEEDRPAFAKAIAAVMDTGGPETLAVDARVRTGSDQWRWLRIRGSVVRDRGGNAKRIAGSMIDISLRKSAEAQLEEERHLLRQLIDCVPLQIYFKNTRSEFVMANQGLADWHGFKSPADLLGKHDRELFDEAHWRPAEQDEIEIMRTREAITNKLEQETWNTEKETWVITSKFPWLDRAGKVRGTFGVSSNVTELVQAQQRASSLAEQLHIRNLAYEEELLLAREIQQAFASAGFPDVATDDVRLAFGARHIPISGMAGDFHESIQIDDHRVGLLICDVMGHGVRSALVVAMLRGLLEKMRGYAGSPAAFLSGLNEGLASILQRAGVTMFATAFYGVVDLRKREFSYACAGHPGPVLCDARQGTRQLGVERASRGPALGLLANATFPELITPLHVPSRLILHTDGVLEAENPHGELFERHLADVIHAHADQPLEAALDTILNAVLEFSSNRAFDDDVCLLGCDLLKT